MEDDRPPSEPEDDEPQPQQRPRRGWLSGFLGGTEEMPQEPTALEPIDAEPRPMAHERLVSQPARPKVPEYIQRFRFEDLPMEAALAFRQEFYDILWTAEYDAMAEMKLEALGKHYLATICSQDAEHYPENFYAAIDEYNEMPERYKRDRALVLWGLGLARGKRSKLTLRELQEPFKAVPTEAMNVRVREELEAFQKPPDTYGVIQVAQLVAQAVRERDMMFLIIDGSPYLRSPYGCGKSQLLMQILYWAYRELDRQFDLRKDVVYLRDRDRMLRMFQQVRDIAWGVDEIDLFYDRREWNRPENKAIIHATQVYRKAGCPILGACGSLWNLDERVRHKIATHRLEITRWNKQQRVGAASLYLKYGPPIDQREEQDQWGRFDFPIEFRAVVPSYYDLYTKCHERAMTSENDGGLDSVLLADPLWPNGHQIPQESPTEET